jgi:hypothetical protein
MIARIVDVQERLDKEYPLEKREKAKELCVICGEYIGRDKKGEDEFQTLSGSLVINGKD